MSQAITGQGIISPSPKNADKKFKASLIMSEQEYLVEPKGAGVDFIDLVGTKVKVQAILNQKLSDELDFSTIFVKNYEIVDDLDDIDWFGKKE